MKLVTRADLGWGVSPAADQGPNKGVKVHYLGERVDPRILSDHGRCAELWRGIRDSHLANTSEKWVDIAYNEGACPHGWSFEGRGPGKRTGANGNQQLNTDHYAIVAMIGDSGVTEPTDAMLTAIRDSIELRYRTLGRAGNEIKGHRDGYATSCPGEPLYRWVSAGAPRPAQPVVESGRGVPLALRMTGVL